MKLELQTKIQKNNKIYQLLKENSYWIKYLNRDPNTYQSFINDMKTKYHFRLVDKVNDVITNIDIINTIIKNLK